MIPYCLWPKARKRFKYQFNCINSMILWKYGEKIHVIYFNLLKSLTINEKIIWCDMRTSMQTWIWTWMQTWDMNLDANSPELKLVQLFPLKFVSPRNESVRKNIKSKNSVQMWVNASLNITVLWRSQQD